MTHSAITRDFRFSGVIEGTSVCVKALAMSAVATDEGSPCPGSPSPPLARGRKGREGVGERPARCSTIIGVEERDFFDSDPEGPLLRPPLRGRSVENMRQASFPSLEAAGKLLGLTC
eukprot:1332553-Lingulodinium_polyedra.AAC.1